MNRWGALCCGVGLMLAACDSREEPPPVPVTKPRAPTTVSTSEKTGPAVATPEVQTPIVPAPTTPDPAPLLKLAEEIASADSNTRREAASRLSALGADAAPALPRLMKNLREGDSGTKELTTDVLVAVGSPAVPPLLELLKERDLRYRFTAIDALRKLGPKAQAAAPELIAGMGSVDDRTTRNRVQALVSIGKPAVPALIEVLSRSPAPGAQERMIQERTRQDICMVLMQLAPVAEEALPILKPAAEKNPQSWDGRAYATIRARTSKLADIAVELSHADPKVRRQAAEAIRLLGPAAKDALPAMMEALKRGDDVAMAIQAVGPDAVLPLFGVMESAPEDVVRQTVEILEKFELPPEAVPRLGAMLQPPVGERFEGALLLLKRLGPKGVAAIPQAASLLRSSRLQARFQALDFLKRTGSPEAASAMAPFLKDADLGYRMALLRALSEMGPAALPARQAIRDQLKDDDSAIRSLAETILKSLEGAK